MTALDQDTIDAINEAISDARIDGDWRSDPQRFANELAKRGLCIVAAELVPAARRVLTGLNDRIDAASSGSVPLFDGIADLHDALNKMQS